MTIWDDLGFRENPYSTSPVPANDEGIRLLVGRETQLRRLESLLTSSTSHATIEGANGVGKTSLVSIAAYKLFKDYTNAPSVEPMFIPVSNPFQISTSETAEEFADRFLITLAREITRNRNVINDSHSGLRNLPDLDRWLNDPVMNGAGGGASVLGVGANVTISRSANTGSGFLRGGLEGHLREMLDAIFPRKGFGGFVCVLDNLELLDTSARARVTLEALRDGPLNFPGVKWVLCGSRGIIRSVVSTPRLHGKLAEPMELGPLGPDHVNSVIEKRLNEYKTRTDAYAPVEADGFRRIYEIGNRNLRNALKYCEDFVFWVADNGDKPSQSADKLALLEAWFATVSDRYRQDTGNVTNRAWEVFEGICSKREGMSPSDFEELGFNSAQAMQPYLRALEQANLIESSTDETDKRRKTISLTYFARMDRPIPEKWL